MIENKKCGLNSQSGNLLGRICSYLETEDIFNKFSVLNKHNSIIIWLKDLFWLAYFG
jgi:hypothetical protein